MRTASKAAMLVIVAAFSFTALANDRNNNNPVAMKLNLSWRGRAITVADKHLAHTFYFEDEVEAYQIHSAKLLSARETGGFIYFLFDVTGYSLGSSPVGRGFCGSGEEKNLIWLKLDSGWNALDKQSVLYASCTQSIEPHDNEDPAWSGDLLSFVVDDHGKNEARKIEYSLKAPDKGLKVTTEGALK